MEAKESKMARENKWKGVGSCEWTWRDSKAISMAQAKQKPITISAHSMWCTTNKPASWACFLAPFPAAREATTTFESTVSTDGEGRGSCG